MMRFLTTLSLAEQNRRLTLSIGRGPRGPRLSFIGGPTFEVVTEFPSIQAAEFAMAEAKRLAAPWAPRKIVQGTHQ